MSNSYRFKKETALPRAQALLEQLRPVCTQIEIAGSLRRGKETAGDIEIVALPTFEQHVVAGQLDMFGGGTPATVEQVSQLDKALEDLIVSKEIYRERIYTHEKGRWGEKQKTFWAALQVGEDIEYIQVDLFIVTPPAQWGPIFTIRTGPSDFGRALMQYINSRTLLKQNDGYLSYRGTGEVVQTPTEQAYFDALGLAWIAPADRCADVLKRAVKRNGGSTAPAVKPVKALTLHQPWASLIAAGLKQYETRSWSTSYRGPLAIHAGQQNGELDLAAVLTDKERARLPGVLPSGAVVCLCRLVDVVKSEMIAADPEFSVSRESHLGNFAPGRHGWKLEVVKVFDPPIPARGEQGLWEWGMPIDEPSATEFPAPEKPGVSGHEIQIEPPARRKILYTDEENRTFIRARLEMAAGVG